MYVYIMSSLFKDENIIKKRLCYLFEEVDNAAEKYKENLRRSDPNCILARQSWVRPTGPSFKKKKYHEMFNFEI